MFKFIGIIWFIGLASGLPFASYNHPKDVEGQNTGYHAVEKNAQPVEHTQTTYTNKEAHKNEDNHNKLENLFEKLAHHKDKPVGDVEEKHNKPALFKKNEAEHPSFGNHKHASESENVHENLLQKIAHKTEDAIKHTGQAIHEGHEKFVNNTEIAIKKTGEAIHDKSVKIADETGSALKQAGENIKSTAEHVVDKSKKILKGEEPIADLNVNTRLKVFNNEIQVKGEMRIGLGHQTGAHGDASAHILGQSAHINADILNSPALDKPPNQEN